MAKPTGTNEPSKPLPTPSWPDISKPEERG
jgi:hypothetical protein